MQTHVALAKNLEVLDLKVANKNSAWYIISYFGAVYVTQPNLIYCSLLISNIKQMWGHSV